MNTSTIFPPPLTKALTKYAREGKYNFLVRLPHGRTCFPVKSPVGSIFMISFGPEHDEIRIFRFPFPNRLPLTTRPHALKYIARVFGAERSYTW